MMSQNFSGVVNLVISLMMLSILFSCTQNNEVEKQMEDKELLLKGAEITKQLSFTLQSELSFQIKENGIIEAINYCKIAAFPLTDSISKSEGVKISRVSHRYRNKKNAANRSELKIINSYKAQLKKGLTLEPLLVFEDSKTTYYSPILLGMPTCLQCHGKQNVDVEDEVWRELKRKYPKDLATGFEMGDLRGLFKVEFKN